MTPGKQTLAAVPLVASHESECMTKARSALDFGASTPAGENLGSLIMSGLASPSHLIEYGGLEKQSLQTVHHPSAWELLEYLRGLYQIYRNLYREGTY